MKSVKQQQPATFGVSVAIETLRRRKLDYFDIKWLSQAERNELVRLARVELNLHAGYVHELWAEM